MGAGRPTDFRPEYPLLAKTLYENGATDAEVADVFRVSITTLKTWKSERPEFLAVLKGSKAIVDNRVERSLYERAVGYTFESEKIFCKDGVVTRVPVREHIPPDVTAQIFWLKNRRPEEWRETSVGGTTINLNLSGQAAERLADRIAPVLDAKLEE